MVIIMVVIVKARLFFIVFNLEKKDVFRNTEKARACQTQNQKNEDFF